MENVDKLLERLLTEEMSVSQEVAYCTGLLYNYIIKLYQDQHPTSAYPITIRWQTDRIYISEAFLKAYRIVPSDALNQMIPTVKLIIATAIELSTEDEFYEMIEGAEFGGDSVLTDGLLKLTFPIIGGRLREDFLKRIIAHELEHFFQYSKSQKIKADKSYNMALFQMDNSDDPTDIAISSLLYYFNQQELDAKVHEFYVDLVQRTIATHNNIKETYPMRELHNVIETYYEPLKTTDSKTLSNKLQPYGYSTINGFIKYIDRQITYYYRKIRKVYAYYSLGCGLNEIVIKRKKQHMRML